MKLEKDLKEYREITLQLFERIKINGDRLVLLKKREELLEKIKGYNYNKNELKKLIEKFEINKLDRELKEKVKEEMNSLKQQIFNLKKSEKSNQAYINARYNNHVLSGFDKKI